MQPFWKKILPTTNFWMVVYIIEWIWRINQMNSCCIFFLFVLNTGSLRLQLCTRYWCLQWQSLSQLISRKTTDQSNLAIKDLHPAACNTTSCPAEQWLTSFVFLISQKLCLLCINWGNERKGEEWQKVQGNRKHRRGGDRKMTISYHQHALSSLFGPALQQSRGLWDSWKRKNKIIMWQI